MGHTLIGQPRGGVHAQSPQSTCDEGCALSTEERFSWLCDDHLAEHLARAERAEALGGLLEGQDAVDDRARPAGVGAGVGGPQGEVDPILEGAGRQAPGLAFEPQEDIPLPTTLSPIVSNQTLSKRCANRSKTR